MIQLVWYPDSESETSAKSLPSKTTRQILNKESVLITSVCLNPLGILSYPDNFIEFSKVYEAVIPQNFFSPMPLYYN